MSSSLGGDAKFVVRVSVAMTNIKLWGVGLSLQTFPSLPNVQARRATELRLRQA